MEMVTAEIKRFATKHEEGLLHHEKVEAIQLLCNSELLRRLERTKPFELVTWTLNPEIRQCSTTTQPPIVSGKLTRDTSAVVRSTKDQCSVSTQTEPAEPLGDAWIKST